MCQQSTTQNSNIIARHNDIHNIHNIIYQLKPPAMLLLANYFYHLSITFSKLFEKIDLAFYFKLLSVTFDSILTTYQSTSSKAFLNIHLVELKEH